jgi:rubredoxin
MKSKIHYECPDCGFVYEGNDEKGTEHDCGGV